MRKFRLAQISFLLTILSVLVSKSLAATVYGVWTVSNSLWTVGSDWILSAEGSVPSVSVSALSVVYVFIYVAIALLGVLPIVLIVYALLKFQLSAKTAVALMFMLIMMVFVMLFLFYFVATFERIT